MARAPEVPLVRLALARFHTLTRAERALLEFADKSNPNRGEFAIGGTSDKPLDPSNDPSHADEWPHDRDVRAELIRWLAVDDGASRTIDPNGVRILGARIVGPIDLAHVRMPFGILLGRCSLSEKMKLESADLPYLDLSGSHTSQIDAADIVVHGDLNFSAISGNLFTKDLGAFEASGVVNLAGARIEGFANFNGGRFQYREDSSVPWTKPLRVALFISAAKIGGDLSMGFGFESRGCAFVAENSVGGDLNCSGGRFINPGNAALEGGGNDIRGWVVLGAHPMGLGGDFVANGLVMFEHSQVGATFGVVNARFDGKASEQHGLYAPGMSVRNEFIWWNAKLENGGSLDLSDARVGALLDDEKSWPVRGRLLVNGLTYGSLPGGTSVVPQWKSPVDARSRLRWLALQDGFHPQPYRQLAKVLRENGDEAGAIEVLVAQEDARFRNSSWIGQAWAQFLKITVGYGHKPLRTVLWSLAVILTGWLLVTIGARAGVMHETWPDSPPPGKAIAYEKLHPLLYSLDVFLPFVNLHQERYWWPDAEKSGDCALFGQKVRIGGSFLRYYLWMQVIAGWLLSAIFVAGVTGLMRND